MTIAKDLCYADEYGVGHPLCLELAELFSRAIDSAKTGKRCLLVYVYILHNEFNIQTGTGELVRIPSKFYLRAIPHYLTHNRREEKRHSTSVLGG